MGAGSSTLRLLGQVYTLEISLPWMNIRYLLTDLLFTWINGEPGKGFLRDGLRDSIAKEHL